MMTSVLDTLSLVAAALGLVVLMLSGVHPTAWRKVIPVAMELWTGAGLLRLSGNPNWTQIATAAAIIMVRRLALIALARAR